MYIDGMSPSNKLIITFCLLLSFSTVSSQAQQRIDSLRQALLQGNGSQKIETRISLAQSLLYANPTEGEAEILLVLEDSKINEMPKSHARALMVYGALLNESGQFYKSQEISLGAIAMAEEGGWNDIVCAAKLNTGTSNIRIGNYTQAAEDHFEGALLAREIDDSDLELTHLMNLGVLKIQLGLNEEALKFLDRALEVSLKNNDKFRQAQVLGNLGYLEYVNQNIGRSRDYHEQSLTLFLELGDQVQAANAHNNLGYAYSLLGKTEQAKGQYQQALNIYETIGDANGIARVILNQAKIQATAGKLKAALDLSEEVIQTSKSLGINARQLEVYQLRQNLYEQLGEYENALIAYKRYVALKDSISDQTNEARIANITAKYDFEELSKEAQLRTKEVEIQSLKLKQRNQWLIASAALLLILVVTFLWNRSILKGKLSMSRREIDLNALEHQVERQKLVKFTEDLAAKNEALQIEVNSRDSEAEDTVEEPETNILMLEKLSASLVDEKDWKRFNIYFDALYPGFYESLNSNTIKKLTLSEKRLAALVKLELTNKEIAAILNISRNSVVKAKYRLRQHLQLNETKEMEDFLVNL